MSKENPTVVATDLVVAERSDSRAIAQAEVATPDPETEEEALASLEKHTILPAKLAVTELDQK